MRKRKRLIIIIGIAVFVISAILMGISVWGYNQNFGHRVEYVVHGNETTFEKLLNMNRQEVSFSTGGGTTLSGYIYTGKVERPKKAMVVFVHGFGGTHQYMSAHDRDQ